MFIKVRLKKLYKLMLKDIYHFGTFHSSINCKLKMKMEIDKLFLMMGGMKLLWLKIISDIHT